MREAKPSIRCVCAFWCHGNCVGMAVVFRMRAEVVALLSLALPVHSARIDMRRLGGAASSATRAWLPPLCDEGLDV